MSMEKVRRTGGDCRLREQRPSCEHGSPYEIPAVYHCIVSHFFCKSRFIQPAVGNVFTEDCNLFTVFRQDKAIYLQMADRLCDGILAGRYSPGGRIPSVRELSEMMEVNTNTVVRAYDLLTRQGIVYTRRGMGYFVSDNAPEMIKADRRRQFMEEKLPEMFR